MNGDNHVHGLENAVLLRYQFFLTWSVDSMQSQAKSQKTVLCSLKNKQKITKTHSRV